MAYDDIQVYSSPWGSHGRAEQYPMEASETFGKGDVVTVALDGQIEEAADEVVPEDLLGVAMAGPSGPGGTTLNNPRTGTTYADGDLIPVIMPDIQTRFITKNYTLAGTAFDDTVPAVAEIGDIASLTVVAGVWGIDSAPTATGETCRIVDVLNGRKESIVITGETLTLQSAGGAYWIVFAIVAHQFTGPTVLTDPTV